MYVSNKKHSCCCGGRSYCVWCMI